ncbi:hypothetical protein FQN52_009448 [Onygenales sp. PD_12]|nr:hypothetical protein FQN52_009448 [Onygenales sp. PD_12]KAK2788276.1 hypothetical protein FQN53_003808 [Emmonsiellopsis sp. PD_33]
MLGLAAYSSSSEDEDQPSRPANAQQPKQPESSLQNTPVLPADGAGPDQPPQPAIEDPNKPLVGPFQPSQHPSPANDTPSTSRKSSPFSSNRTLIHDMTLPPIPNLDIPPSPPGSPNPAANQKFAHFLSLKRQGVHFNEKLASSSSLRNPGLLSKLMEHAGIDEQVQYATSLPADLWDTSTLPPWGYKEELQKSQQDIRRKIEEKKASTPREAIDFVSGGASGESSRGGTPASGKGKLSAAERVMAGLSRERTSSPMNPERGGRASLERRPRGGDLSQKRQRSRSPPPRRKRSRSR